MKYNGSYSYDTLFPIIITIVIVIITIGWINNVEATQSVENNNKKKYPPATPIFHEKSNQKIYDAINEPQNSYSEDIRETQSTVQILNTSITEKEILIVGGMKAKVCASSELLASKFSDRYSVKNAFDGDPKTAWVEGVKGDGEDEFIVVDFQKQVKLDGVILYPGYTKNAKTFTKNSVPREIEIHVNNSLYKKYQITYDLKMFIPELDDKKQGFRNMGCYHTGNKVNFSPRIIIFEEPINVNKIMLIVKKSLSGSKYHDLCMSEWTFLFSETNDSEFGVPVEIISILKDLRNGNSDNLNINSDAFIEDLRTKYIRLDPGKGFEYHETPPQDINSYYSRIESDVKSCGDSIYDKFLKYTIFQFVNNAVVVFSKKDFYYIIGVKAISYGVSEWLEFYPTIVLDSNYTICALKELKHFDGAPGCEDVIPTSQ